MIDLDAIKKRIAEADELRKVSIGEWPLSGGVGDDAVEDRKELVDEIERLRGLIPDVGMLEWLVKAAEVWWKDNGGEGTHPKDIAAGYALVEKLYGEMDDCPVPCDGCGAVLLRGEICPLADTGVEC